MASVIHKRIFEVSMLACDRCVVVVYNTKTLATIERMLSLIKYVDIYLTPGVKTTGGILP